MKIVTKGNISLENYNTSTYFEEFILTIESMQELPTEFEYTIDQELSAYLESIATEGVVRESGRILANSFNLSKTITKAGTSIANMGLKKTADIIRLLNNELKRMIPELIKRIREFMENTEAVYMKLTKFDQKFKEVAIRMQDIVNTRSYEYVENITPTTIKFYNVQANVFKEFLDVIGDYHILCNIICGINLTGPNITVKPTDCIYDKRFVGKELIYPKLVMDKLKEHLKGEDGPNIKEMINVMKIANESVSEYNKMMTREGSNTILIDWFKKYGNKLGIDIPFIVKTMTTKSTDGIKDANKNKTINPVKLALIPTHKTISFKEGKSWLSDGRKTYANEINKSHIQGGMVQSFLLLVNGRSNKSMDKSTSSVIVDLIKSGGVNVKKHTQTLERQSKKELDELISFVNGLGREISTSERQRVDDARNNDIRNTKTGDQVVSADTNVGGKEEDNVGRNRGDHASQDLAKLSQLAIAYLTSWFTIIMRINSMYNTITSGTLGAVYNLTTEVDLVCNFLDHGSKDALNANKAAISTLEGGR